MDTSLIFKGLIIVVSLVAGVTSYRYFNLREDNHIEESSEAVIYEVVGLDIDLSPLTPE